jgi:hypothetical protein
MQKEEWLKKIKEQNMNVSQEFCRDDVWNTGTEIVLKTTFNHASLFFVGSHWLLDAWSHRTNVSQVTGAQAYLNSSAPLHSFFFLFPSL